MLEVRRFTLPDLPYPLGAYSDAISFPIGDSRLVLLTGQVAVDSSGTVVSPNDPEEQAKFIFDRVDRLLRAAGACLDDVVRAVFYLTDIADFPHVSKVRNVFLATSRPATTTVQVENLVIPGCRVEVEVTAVVFDIEDGFGT